MFVSYEYLVFSIMVSGVLAPNLFLNLRKNHDEETECLDSHWDLPTLVSSIIFK